MQISSGIASGGKPTMSERISDMAEKVSTPAAYTISTGTATAGMLGIGDWAVIIGILGTIATVLMNWYFNRRRLEMEEREHNARMKKLDASNE